MINNNKQLLFMQLLSDKDRPTLLYRHVYEYLL